MRDATKEFYDRFEEKIERETRMEELRDIALQLLAEKETAEKKAAAMNEVLAEARALVARFFEGDTDYIPKRKLDELSSRDDVFQVLNLVRRLVKAASA